MKILKKIGWALLLVLVVAQFFGPEKNEGEITSLDAFIAETNPPENVLNILKESCFDCHSNVTRYPWYSNITPVNYWMDDHVKVGKKKLNFSKWPEYSLKRKEHKMEELYEEVEEKNMPLESYTYTHSEANLTLDQIAVIVDWGKKTQENYKQQMNAK
ncbi:heme-binding domain-containing protein [Polaribacter sp. MSW13]|uniref:Heme-binding domain-containing protein n=1 Tax=Polaribacter marinus TaxID=2916838 RepID=A0A9X2AL03_9FLAO|nr:heme-binding domain-containing protein [Polaribacter marinus]MCI2228750.1 heme-binding domain-containing protein [Polaribacter marinus]